MNDFAADLPRCLAVELRGSGLAGPFQTAVAPVSRWSDIEVPPYETPETDEAQRRLESFEDEIIDRPFDLNAQRAEEERRLGLAAGGGGVARGGEKAPAGKKKGSTGHEEQGGLF